MSSLGANFLDKRVRKIIGTLSKYGFIVNTVVENRASENGSTFCRLATLTACERLDGNLDLADVEKLPLERKIAFCHRYHRFFVFIGRGMSHWVKKFVSVLKFSGKRSRQLRCFPVDVTYLFRCATHFGRILVSTS